jgi:hypothetical protein
LKSIGLWIACLIKTFVKIQKGCVLGGAIFNSPTFTKDGQISNKSVAQICYLDSRYVVYPQSIIQLLFIGLFEIQTLNMEDGTRFADACSEIARRYLR